MASSPSFFPSSRAEFHPPLSDKNAKTTNRRKPSISTPHLKKNASQSSSKFTSPFPQSLELPALKDQNSSIMSYQLADSPYEGLGMNLENLTTLQQTRRGFDYSQLNLKRVFVQDPPWITSLILKNFHHGVKKRETVEWKEKELRRRQIKAETEAWEKMTEEYKEFERQMCEKKLAPSLPYVRSLCLGWFEPLRKAIEEEQAKKKSKMWEEVAPYIDSIAADKLAVIVMHKMMELLMVNPDDRSVPLVHAATVIGKLVEQEVRIQKFLDKAKNLKKKMVADEAQQGVSEETMMLAERVRMLIKRKRMREIQKIMRTEEYQPWSEDTRAKLGCLLIELLIETAYVQTPSHDSAPDVQPAFRHIVKTKTSRRGARMKCGVIECNEVVLTGCESTVPYTCIPYVPMLVPPKKWKGYDRGGYFFLPSQIVRHASKHHRNCVKGVPPKQMQKIYEALDILGSTKWRVNRRVLAVVENMWAKGGNIAGLVAREDVYVPELCSEDLSEIKKWKSSVWKARKVNQERFALRCETELKLSVAREMKDEEGFYFPHNLDFRGRAYPMHPHLNHLSSDLCRGILEFAEGRPLGKSGFHWLKIHLANLYGAGVEKLSYDGRLAFVENHLNDIIDSADNPVDGNRWWLTAEDPFQCLATCIALSEALKSSTPHSVISHQPVHQDGSCNGLQHYAALGRDCLQAAAVNLLAGEKPSDVYSEIAVRVHDIMLKDSEKDPAIYPNALLARVLVGQVNRKLVKQTVMTSVYGVTYIGARDQIRRRLQEKGDITDDKLLSSASSYAAKVTMEALTQLFEAARGTMVWLGNCAKVIASENQPVQWTTPLGLPIMQPYFKMESHSIKTSLQRLSLRRESNSVDARKQRNAFPPNFVHSLDATHMMMTALACRGAGLHFAGVHDSYWTHAQDVDKLNAILREKFVELYDEPILENLLESFQTRHPGLKFPPLPERGDFDLNEVLRSPYFFN